MKRSEGLSSLDDKHKPRVNIGKVRLMQRLESVGNSLHDFICRQASHKLTCHVLFGGSGKKDTHVDDDVECVIIGQKDTDTAAVLHGFVVVEAQFVHLRVAGTVQPRCWGSGPSGDPLPAARAPDAARCGPASAAAPDKHTCGLGGRSSTRTGHEDPR